MHIYRNLSVIYSKKNMAFGTRHAHENKTLLTKWNYEEILKAKKYMFINGY